MDPLIVTLGLDASLQMRLDRLREIHFPPDRNHIDAHVTLFHSLPGERINDVSWVLRSLAKAEDARPARVTQLMDLGGGVAMKVDVDNLKSLHKRLQRSFDFELTNQDRQPLRPHVTIQNKVDRATALRTLERLRSEFTPFAGVATGLRLWHYRGGPWDHAADFPFEGET